ncbi:hypothetical protein C0993_005277 [Termitomyces sp. T159_Od127]|nr:hypothetical protein C0993_005277 [Termitomyces sp. T159_Od127]
MPSGALSIFASYDGDGTEVGYTLSTYATLDFDISWDETPSSPPFTKKIHPQRGSATLKGRSKAKVTLTLQTSRDTPVNISLVYSQGGRIDEFVENELLASSGAYSYGMARVRKEMPRKSMSKLYMQKSQISPAGDCTIILSAFEPHYMGPYTLRIESTLAFDLQPIPQEGAGMYERVVRGAWYV